MNIDSSGVLPDIIDSCKMLLDIEESPRVLLDIVESSGVLLDAEEFPRVLLDMVESSGVLLDRVDSRSTAEQLLMSDISVSPILMLLKSVDSV